MSHVPSGLCMLGHHSQVRCGIQQNSADRLRALAQADSLHRKISELWSLDQGEPADNLWTCSYSLTANDIYKHEHDGVVGCYARSPVLGS